MSMSAMVIYGCGCGIGTVEGNVVSVSVCLEHRERQARRFEELARLVGAEASKEHAPVHLDPEKVGKTLERVLAEEHERDDHVDGSA